VFLTNGYSIKKKKFKKAKKTLTKQGVRVAIELLILLSILLALFLAYRLFGFSCSVILPLAIIVAIVFYFSRGNRWNRLKQKTIKIYKKLRNYFKKLKS
jgi:Flp pilus assembly protein TadB